MKKIIIFLLITVISLTSTSCFAGPNLQQTNPSNQNTKTEKQLKDPKTVKLNLLNSKTKKFELFKEFKVENKTQLNSLPKPLYKNGKYFLGWFKDSEFKTRFRTKNSLKPDTVIGDLELYGQLKTRNTVDLVIQALKSNQTDEEKQWNTVYSQEHTKTSLKLFLNTYIQPQLIGVNKKTGEEFKYWQTIYTNDLEEITFTANFTKTNQDIYEYFQNFRLKITLNSSEYEFSIKNTLTFLPNAFNFGEAYYLHNITYICIELIADKTKDHKRQLKDFAKITISSFSLVYQVEEFEERTE